MTTSVEEAIITCCVLIDHVLSVVVSQKKFNLYFGVHPYFLFGNFKTYVLHSTQNVSNLVELALAIRKYENTQYMSWADIIIWDEKIDIAAEEIRDRKLSKNHPYFPAYIQIHKHCAGRGQHVNFILLFLLLWKICFLPPTRFRIM